MAAACVPNLANDDALVTQPQILAVVAEPPEAPPGSPATYTALVATPDGAGRPTAVVWRFCTAPKPLDVDNVVSPSCFDAASLVTAGSGSPTMASTAIDACALFGPETPPGGARPRDPDDTGGYYQPLRSDFPGADPTFYLARIRCDLANAPADIAALFASQYVSNANPHLEPLAAAIDGDPISLSSVPAGVRVTLEASWPAADAETYAYFDPSSQTLSTKREAMRVAWHSNGGTFDTEATGRDETDPSTSTDNVWTAPSQAGSVSLWLVLRDSRGGTDFAQYDVIVGSVGP